MKEQKYNPHKKKEKNENENVIDLLRDAQSFYLSIKLKSFYFL